VFAEELHTDDDIEKNFCIDYRPAGPPIGHAEATVKTRRGTNASTDTARR
jgi:hypothetical protein